MNLSSESVELYIGKEVDDPCASMETTIGELASACQSGQCPMGLFSCPLEYGEGYCHKVTERTWASFFDMDEEYGKDDEDE